MRRGLLPPAVYSLAACVFTWPLVLHLTSRLGVPEANADSALNLGALGWDLQTVGAHLAWLFDGRTFDAGIFHPARGTLAFSDQLLLQAIALWPVYAATRHLVFCYNLLLVASLAASAWAAHALARETVGHEPAAYVAGVIFGFAPYHFTHLARLPLQSLYWLPLTLLFLHRLRARDRWRDCAGLGVTAGLQFVSSVDYGIIGGVGLAVAAIVLAVSPGPKRRGRFLTRCVAALIVAAAIALPFAWASVRAGHETGARQDLVEAARGSAALTSYLQAPATNALYGRTGWLRPGPNQRLPRKDGPDQALFPGFGALLLACCAWLGASRESRVHVHVYAALVVAGVVLSLGPDGIRPLYSALYDTVPGMPAVQAPARFSVLALAGIAVLASATVRELDERLQHGPRIAAPAALTIVTLECFNGAITFAAPPALSTPAGSWWQAQPGTGDAVCVRMAVAPAPRLAFSPRTHIDHPLRFADRSLQGSGRAQDDRGRDTDIRLDQML